MIMLHILHACEWRYDKPTGDDRAAACLSRAGFFRLIVPFRSLHLFSQNLCADLEIDIVNQMDKARWI